MNTIVINCSSRYNIALHRLATWLRGQGWVECLSTGRDAHWQKDLTYPDHVNVLRNVLIAPRTWWLIVPPLLPQKSWYRTVILRSVR